MSHNNPNGIVDRLPEMDVPTTTAALVSRDRLSEELAAARSENTRRQYAGGWTAFAAWTSARGHVTRPAAPEVITEYLVYLADRDASASTIRAARAAIGAAHRDAALDDPCADEGVRRSLKGLVRQAAGRGRGQAQPLSVEDVERILATASIPRRTGRGIESADVAERRGAVDRAIAGLLFQGALRRSEAATLTWADVERCADRRGLLIRVRRSKTNQEAERADVRYLKNGAADAVWALRPPAPRDDQPVLGGLNGASIARRLAAAAKAANIDGRITGHSGRVELACELTTRGASTTEIVLAGGWKTARMVAHYAACATAQQGAVAKYL